MDRQLKKIIKFCILFMVISSFIAPVSASPGFNLENIKNWLFPSPDTQVKPLTVEGNAQISPYRNQFNALDGEVDRLATKHNLEQCYAVMDRMRYTAVRVDVVDDNGAVQRSYYLVRDGGIVENYTGAVDKSFKITHEEAIKIRDMVQDGEVSFKERVKIGSILTGTPEFIQYFKLTMYGG